MNKKILQLSLFILFIINMAPIFSQISAPRFPKYNPPSLPKNDPLFLKYPMFNQYYRSPAPPKYDIHEGKVFFSGTNYSGKIKIKKTEVWFENETGTKDYDIKFNGFVKCVLKGTNEKVRYRNDSTEIFYLKQFNSIFRKITDSIYESYDNSFIIDENTNLPIDYYRIIKKDDTTFIKLDNVRSFKKVLGSTAYFEKLDSILKLNNEMNEDEVLLEDFFNLAFIKNINDSLHWAKIQVYLKSNQVIDGVGMLHPLRYVFSTYLKLRPAYIHVYTDNKFYIFNHEEVDSFILDNKVYKPFYLKNISKHCFCNEWDFEGNKYLITRKYDDSGEPLIKLSFTAPEKKDCYVLKRSLIINNIKNQENELLLLQVKEGKIIKVNKQKELIQKFKLVH